MRICMFSEKKFFLKKQGYRQNQIIEETEQILKHFLKDIFKKLIFRQDPSKKQIQIQFAQFYHAPKLTQISYLLQTTLMFHLQMLVQKVLRIKVLATDFTLPVVHVEFGLVILMEVVNIMQGRKGAFLWHWQIVLVKNRQQCLKKLTPELVDSEHIKKLLITFASRKGKNLGVGQKYEINCA